MKRKTVVLGLFADRIDVLVCTRDQVVASRRLAVAFGSDVQTWYKTMHEAAPLLRKAVEELGIDNAATTVLYRNATACADSASLGIRSSSQACQAATLSCSESLTCPLDDAAHAAIMIGRDKTGDSPQSHIVVAADHDAAVDAITTLVQEAGLCFEVAAPLDAALMARLGDQALKTSQANQGFLYVGEHRSFFIIADRGRLLFCRTIGLGSDSLIWSLTKPMRGANGSAQIELSFEDARTLLHHAGFPKRDEVVSETHGLVGSQIIPLLQPVLQRFTVELRQSLRFGVAEDQRQSVSLHVSGPGSSIPNFASVIAAELGVNFTADQRYATFDCLKVESDGSEMKDALQSRRRLSSLGLQPRRLAFTRSLKHVQRWMWAGASVAVAMIAMESLHFQARVSDARKQVAAMQVQAGDSSLQATGERLFKVIATMDKLEAEIGAATGTSINARACLQELSRITPDAIRLISVSFSQEQGKTVGRIAGCAFDRPDSAGRLFIEPFVTNLKQSPLFEDVTLSNVTAGSIGSKTGQQFIVSLTAVGVPHDVPANAVSVADGGASQ